MRFDRCLAAALTLAAASAAFGLSGAARAEPLVRSGIGLSSCEKLGPSLRPGAGFDHMPNALLFYWVQGYISAANIHLLNEYTDYVDVGAVEEPAITKLVADYCKANASKRPLDAIDQFIRRTKKIEVKESDAFDPWEH
jgi:hypothetical protein